MKTVSVEYAHIYTNSRISEEHTQSLLLLDQVKAENAASIMNLVVMVDDYSFPDPTFDYRQFSDWLEGQGYKPDLIIRESQLIPVCDELLMVMDGGKLKDSIVDYVKSKKYPCSLFIAAWYLARLGYLETPLVPDVCIANSLINILPESFRPFEEKGLNIIKQTPYNMAVQDIEYKFIEGRLLA